MVFIQHVTKEPKTGKRLMLLFLFIITGFYIRAQTADGIINRYVSFIGGKKQWKKVSTIITTGEYVYGGVSFPFTSYNKAPDLYKFIVTSNGKYYAQAFDGNSGWKIDMFNGETSPALLNGKPARGMSNEANVELEDGFINYRGKGHQVSFEGKDTVRGKSCFKIKLIRKSGETETYYFEEKTGELVMKKAVSKNAELGGALLSISYDDYRKVKDIKIPFKVIVKTEDQLILTITVKSVELNATVADSEFQPQANK